MSIAIWLWYMTMNVDYYILISHLMFWLQKILEDLCSLTPVQSQMFARYIQRHIDHSAVMQKVGCFFSVFPVSC